MLVALLLVALGGCAATEHSVNDLMQTRKGAYLAYQEGNYSEAIKQFNQLVAAMPKDSDLWFRLGNAYARNLQPRQAVLAYENALLRDPHLKKAWYNMGLVQLKEALKTFDEMAQYVSPDDPIGQQGVMMRARLIQLLQQQENPQTSSKQ